MSANDCQEIPFVQLNKNSSNVSVLSGEDEVLNATLLISEGVVTSTNYVSFSRAASVAEAAPASSCTWGHSYFLGQHPTLSLSLSLSLSCPF